MNTCIQLSADQLAKLTFDFTPPKSKPALVFFESSVTKNPPILTEGVRVCAVATLDTLQHPILIQGKIESISEAGICVSSLQLQHKDYQFGSGYPISNLHEKAYLALFTDTVILQAHHVVATLPPTDVQQFKNYLLQVHPELNEHVVNALAYFSYSVKNYEQMEQLDARETHDSELVRYIDTKDLPHFRAILSVDQVGRELVELDCTMHFQAQDDVEIKLARYTTDYDGSGKTTILTTKHFSAKLSITRGTYSDDDEDATANLELCFGDAQIQKNAVQQWIQTELDDTALSFFNTLTDFDNKQQKSILTDLNARLANASALPVFQS